MIDRKALHSDLIELFIGYQQRLDEPMPSPSESQDMIMIKYHTDPIFRSKILSLAANVMHVVNKHV